MDKKDALQDFVYNDDRNWFRAKYEALLTEHSSRYWTLKSALNLLIQRGGKTIVETGCVRQFPDYGAGNSTLIFADFIDNYGGTLTSIDNDAKHAGICRELLERFNPGTKANVIVNDSVSELKAMARRNEMIDFLYLDSYDFPYVEILFDYFGGHKDWAAAEIAVAKIPLKDFVEKYNKRILPCQEHCLEEIKAASGALHGKSIVLIDDVMAGGGKPRLAKQWLCANGWECILEDRQTLWIKEQ